MNRLASGSPTRWIVVMPGDHAAPGLSRGMHSIVGIIGHYCLFGDRMWAIQACMSCKGLGTIATSFEMDG
jgi:hypothetical protein